MAGRNGRVTITPSANGKAKTSLGLPFPPYQDGQRCGILQAPRRIEFLVSLDREFVAADASSDSRHLPLNANVAITNRVCLDAITFDPFPGDICSPINCSALEKSKLGTIEILAGKLFRVTHNLISDE